jgi:ADP-heptose:LPS heptosyltransferase
MIQNILWIRLDAIGDAVLSMAMLPYVAQRYAGARITVICQQHVAELYRTCPYVDSVIGLDKTRLFLDPTYRVAVIAQLRAELFDLVLNSVYSRELALDCLATTLGAAESVAFRVMRRRGRYDYCFRYNRRYSRLLESLQLMKPELERHRDFLRGLGIETPVLMPYVWLSDQDEAYADTFFEQHKLNPRNTIAFFAGALSASRLYGHYGSAIREVWGDACTILVLGAGGDCLANQQSLQGFNGPAINLCGQTTLRQAAALIKRCRVAIGAETGLAHIACAVNTPNVVVLGGGHFGRFMPYAACTTAVALPLDCYGCDWNCRYTTTHCIQEVNPRLLAYAIRERLVGDVAKPRVVLQDISLHRKSFLGPQWSLAYQVIDAAHVDVVVVTKNMLDLVSNVVVP